MTPTSLEAYVTRALEAAPAVTDAKREELTRLLRPGSRKGRR